VVHAYFLPIYFQTILGVGPISSGIHLLPLILGLAFFSVLGSLFITAKGMAMFVMLAGAIMAAVASGLVYTFGAGTPSSKWIGVLALLGFGYGFTQGLGILVGQLSCKRQDMAVTTAALNCNLLLIGLRYIIVTQTYGAAIFITVAQNLFVNEFSRRLTDQVPDIVPDTLIAAGATDFKTELSPEQLALVLQIFMESLTGAYVVPIALMGTTFFLGLLLDANMRSMKRSEK